MQKIRITRCVDIPDGLRIARYRRAPELGPRILFFSGGTALKRLSRELVGFTHNSIHLITPFDSGGSSAKLREAFHMLSVGDLRNRIMALADRSVHGNADIYRLFSFRFPEEASNEVLAAELRGMVEGNNPLVSGIPDPMRKIIRNHLGFFQDAMPSDFDLRGASVGNLILVGGYLNNGSHIDPVLFLFSKLVEARGVVRPTINQDLTLVAELEDGEHLVGQHRFATGGSSGPSPISRVYLAQNDDWRRPVEVEIRNKVRDLISQAELICFPMGSFYSSIVANLLPRGVGRAVLENDCPKVYIPNTGKDPEQFGMSLADSVDRLLFYLGRDCGGKTGDKKLLDFMIIDVGMGRQYGAEADRIRAKGVEVIEHTLVTAESEPFLDVGELIGLLLSLA
jgi:CofD-related protein of GAK system